jgi:hypothetical protein
VYVLFCFGPDSSQVFGAQPPPEFHLFPLDLDRIESDTLDAQV